MPRVIDTSEGEAAGLFCLAVYDEVGGRDVDVAGWRRGGCGDFDGVVYGFAAEPVAFFVLLSA